MGEYTKETKKRRFNDTAISQQKEKLIIALRKTFLDNKCTKGISHIHLIYY